MPIYAYRCSSCGHEKDVLRKLSDAPLTQCPECGKDTFSKQVTAAGFQLKGSGWYVTDFRGGNNGNGQASKPASAGSDKTTDSADSASSGADSSANSKSNDSAGSTSAPAADAPKPASSAGAA